MSTPNGAPRNFGDKNPPDILAGLVHDSTLRNAVVAVSMIYVSSHFDDFKKYLLEDQPPNVLHAYEPITKALWDIWVFPIIRKVSDEQEQSNMTAIPLDDDQLRNVLDHLMGKH